MCTYRSLFTSRYTYEWITLQLICMCDTTHMCGSRLFMTWLTYERMTSDVTHIWENDFWCDSLHIWENDSWNYSWCNSYVYRDWRLICMCHVTHSYVSHVMSHSLICVTSHIRSHSLICVKWLTTYLYVSRYTFIYVTWLTTYLYVWHDSYVRRDSFMTKLIHMCNVTCVNMCHVYISENASYAETASLKLYVSFAKEPYKRDDIHTMRFQKTRRIIASYV